MGRYDRFFLLTHLLKRADAIHPWLYDRCREVEAEPEGHLDLWARGHYKSTIITFAGVIQEILKDPEITVGIFSHTKPISRAFLRQIKLEFAGNDLLKKIYPDVLYFNPEKDSPVWSEENGIVVKRQSNPKEATVEAWGLVDGQPVSKHFQLLVFDDTVTRESVNTPDQILKTTESWELAQHLTSTNPRKWHIGTRYNFGDTYGQLLERKAVKPRVYAATDDGLPDGKPVFLSPEVWEKTKAESSAQTIACHCAGTTVLMSDWTYKNIEDVVVGDEVVGFIIGNGKGNKLLLQKSEVIAINKRISKAREYILASGDSVRCTPDHKWWSKRSSKDGHLPYSQLGNLGAHDLKVLYRLARKPDNSLNPEWQYLAGIIDGEGTLSGNRIVITQSHEHNPEVTEKIRETLQNLGIDYSTYIRPAFSAGRKTSKASTLFLINGGRHERHRILLNAKPAKSKPIIDSLYCHIGGKSCAEADKVVSWTELGEQEVFNIQTTTGNYVANGFASKNCQMLQNPIAGSEQEMKPEWLRKYEIRPQTLNIYILGDYAGSRKSTGSSSTALIVIGVDTQLNKYLLDGACHKMGLEERWTRLRDLRKKWLREPGVQVVEVGYERFGAQSDIEHFEAMMRLEGESFPIQELAWPRDGDFPKDNRIRRLIPDLKNWRFFFPYVGEPTKLQIKARNNGEDFLISKPIKVKDGDGKLYDLMEYFVKNEYVFFPATTKKDMLDAMSRIYDMEVQGPMIVNEEDVMPEYVED